MHHYAQELRHEIGQRKRAVAQGALVRPSRNIRELEAEEEANAAEITHLSARRSRLWSALGHSLSEPERVRLSWDVQGATRSLEIAFAAKRRLGVARFLFENHIFAK